MTRRTRLACGLAALPLLLAGCGTSGSGDERAEPAKSASPARKPKPPPLDAGLDYQLGGAYRPDDDVQVVVRDHGARPARGLYNVCYVNAFQAQPGARGWPEELLLRDSDGHEVIDEDWDEVLLDLSTEELRRAAADRVGRWIDGCAQRGFDAVEPDNYDSFTRSDGLLDAADAQAYLALLVERAHSRGLAVAQKNTAELAADRKRLGLDFAVAEECGQYEECGVYDRAFDGHVLVVEYTEKGLERACEAADGRLSVVLRDRDVLPEDEEGYVRGAC
ncbi:endo alpha-1,4 polygalactosaminidase [Streptomyces albidoflavus]|uniref:endo alpha-1,4 polygalactosaminidase n=1 Tax=Streptomyces albidoflavus TaxID=1886 RepID=UPI0021D5C2D5|nr:endo alpha-1,4 polygalactosaminidase [Streptomyces albidoflavus]MCU7705565.1 endo alpha-1,4 polygalactosaminidase [Streptomyces albidoflavus]